MRLTFLGAAGTVTGSRYLLETRTTRLMIDCGLFQGIKRLRELNWADPPYDPADVDAVVLTHAHLDHTGWLPVLARGGFEGPVFCTGATAQLCGILLPDSGHLQEEEAEYLNRHRLSKHHPALPLYTREQAQRTLGRLRTAAFEEPFDVGDARVTFFRAGHILGSAWVRVEAEGLTLLFSGDVGRPIDPVMRPPVPPVAADVVLVESTYGNRRHEPVDPADQLADIVRRTFDRGGVLLIPSFAVGRSQLILHLLARLTDDGRIPRVPTYLNSPMAIDATEIYCEHAGEHRLDEAQCRRMFAAAEMVRSSEASKALNTTEGPAVIISASGMATGGRVVHHLKALLPDPRHTVLFAGFQAPGTRGEALVSGAEEVRIHGQDVVVRAEIVNLHNVSAHADRDELIAWLASGRLAPRRVFVVHGEPAAADALRQRLHARFGWNARVPHYRETVELG